MSKPIEHIPSRNGKKRVVIVGGGFGGLKMVKDFDPTYYQIILLDMYNHHQFQPLYYQVATSGIEPSSIAFSFRKILQKCVHVHYRMCTALSVCMKTNRLDTTIGTIDYDYLIIATGAKTNYFGNADLEQSTMSLKTLSDSIYIRNRIWKSFESVINSHDEMQVRKLLNFVIVGGGATGVELAGALSEMRKYILPKDYHDVNMSDMKIYLIDTSDRLLKGFSLDLSRKTDAYLREMGIEVLLQTRVINYQGQMILLENGVQIPTSNVFWVAGVIGNGLPGLPFDLYGRGNRLLVDEYNRLLGVENVFAIGDTCLMRNDTYPEGHPQVAQVAIQQGQNLVENLERLSKGKDMRSFVYHDKGSLATIGRNKAVAKIGSLRFGGFAAWVIWLFVHLMAIVGVKNRLFVLLNWGWSYFTHDTSLRLIISPKRWMNGINKKKTRTSSDENMPLFRKSYKKKRFTQQQLQN